MSELDIEHLAEVAHIANSGEGHPWDDQPEMYQDLMRRIVRALLKELGEEGEPTIKERYGLCTCPHQHDQRICPDIMWEDDVAYCAIQSLEEVDE